MSDFALIEVASVNCDNPEDPLRGDRSSELAVEVWNLRKTVMDLNSQLLQVKAELKTHKNLTKNLKLLSTSLQEENAVRLKENTQLKAKLQQEEKNHQANTTVTANVNSNLARQKKINSSLQMRYNDLEKMSSTKIKDLNAQIELLSKDLEGRDKNSESERLRLEKENGDWVRRSEHMQAVLQDTTLRVQELETDKRSLTEEVESLKERVASIDQFLNQELESAYDSLHSKLENALSENARLKNNCEEKEFECTQLSAHILREGLQIPIIRKLYNPSPPTIPLTTNEHYIEE